VPVAFASCSKSWGIDRPSWVRRSHAVDSDDDPDCLGQLLHLRVQDVAMLRHNVEHEGCPHA
jgi:hypothetical protein